MTEPTPVYRISVSMMSTTKAGKPRGLLPATSNATRQMGHYAQHRSNRKWKELVITELVDSYPALRRHVPKSTYAWLQGAKVFDFAPVDPAYVRATVVFTRYSTGRSDYDGLVRSFKAVQDAVVMAGVVPDDTPEHLHGYYRWRKSTLGEQRIEIAVFLGFVELPAHEEGG